jgi:hypothetical protein
MLIPVSLVWVLLTQDVYAVGMGAFQDKPTEAERDQYCFKDFADLEVQTTQKMKDILVLFENDTKLYIGAFKHESLLVYPS